MVCMEHLITVLAEVVKVTLLWRKCRDLVRNCLIHYPNKCELLMSSSPPSSEAGHVSVRHTCTHAQICSCMARHRDQHIQGTHSTLIGSLILFLLSCWSEGKSASGPQFPGFPLPAAGPWPCQTPRVAASLPLLVLRPPLTATHRLGQTKCRPSFWLSYSCALQYLNPRPVSVW